MAAVTASTASTGNASVRSGSVRVTPGRVYSRTVDAAKCAPFATMISVASQPFSVRSSAIVAIATAKTRLRPPPIRE